MKEKLKLIAAMLVFTMFLACSCSNSELYKDGSFTTTFKNIAKQCKKNLEEDEYTLGSLKNDESFGYVYYPILINDQDTGMILKSSSDKESAIPDEISIKGSPEMLPAGINCAAKVLKTLKPQMSEEETEKTIMDLSTSPILKFDKETYLYNAVSKDDLYIVIFMDSKKFEFYFQNHWYDSYLGTEFVKVENIIDRDEFSIITSDGRPGYSHSAKENDNYIYLGEDAEEIFAIMNEYIEYLNANYEYEDDASGVRIYNDSKGNKLFVKSYATPRFSVFVIQSPSNES